MHYVFGPVPSRRLGQSLGVDPIPLKTCNWNCVYCQLGRTMPVTHKLLEYFPREEILAEIRYALVSHEPGEIDWITFVGSGEPTLHRGLGWLIRQVKDMTSLPVAVITNGSLLYLPEVRLALAPADAVMPTLDAGSARLYRQLNRPHPEATFERLIDGLVTFRQQYQGRLWVEVMLVQGLNDTEDALGGIREILEQVQPDEVHLNLPTRPPAETWVKPPDDEGLMRALAILGEVAHVVHPIEGRFDLSGCDSVETAVIEIITRHPMCQEELERTLAAWAPDQAEAILASLATDDKVQIIERLGTKFWSVASSHYPTEARSRTAKPKPRSST
jgi:wyosine [tRNA(Phe)-imidazoG37] synthetase (radical SAM superfamily)